MVEILRSVLNSSFLEISVGDVITIVVCVIIALILDKLIQFFIVRASKKLEEQKRASKFREIILNNLARPLHVLMITVGCSLGLAIMDTPSWGQTIFSWIFILMRAISIWCLIWYLMLVTNKVTDQFLHRAHKTDDKIDDMAVPLISGCVKVLLFVVGILLIIQNMGYSVSSLLAGLGIGGAALALASKDTLANLFGSLVVFLDRPFQLGDWISLNGVEGEVEEIRLRSTLIRTVDNSLITMPNALLTNTTIDNYACRKVRKMECSFGVLYSTTAAQIEQIVAEIKQHLAEHQDVYGPDYYVGFGGFGASSLDITVTAYTRRVAKSEHFEDRQKFMLEIMRIVEKAGTGFAFPTQTLEWASQSPKMPVHVVMESQKG